ncbi:secretory pathway protein Sec39-domain-containing protein [Mycena sp. CBHHK59/15]|nr:secretory pathway protein Sec39-domain-containing protein [Mycena sp. CBHHK59/15]
MGASRVQGKSRLERREHAIIRNYMVVTQWIRISGGIGKAFRYFGNLKRATEHKSRTETDEVAFSEDLGIVWRGQAKAQMIIPRNDESEDQGDKRVGWNRAYLPIPTRLSKNHGAREHTLEETSKMPSSKTWTGLSDSELTVDNVRQLLDGIKDDLWVAAACADRIVDDVAVQRVLFDIGIERTATALLRSQTAATADEDSQSSTLISTRCSRLAFQPSSCRRPPLRYPCSNLKRLDRLNSFVEICKYIPGNVEDAETPDEWEDDPWAESSAQHDLQNAVEPPVALSTFLADDLVRSAHLLASHQWFGGLRIMFERHGVQLWPYRLAVVDSIPEHVHPLVYRDFLPALDIPQNLEKPPPRLLGGLNWTGQKQRTCEGPLRLPDSLLTFPSPPSMHHLNSLAIIIYYPRMNLQHVKAYLAHSTPESLAKDIWRLVMPYLFVLESRAERAGNPDPSLRTRILYDYVLNVPLETAAAVFEASKPILPVAQRIIQNDEDMARLALACLYGSNSLDEWTIMNQIFECLPAWDITRDDDQEDAADTTVISLGAFVTPSTTRPRCTASDLLIFFQPLPLSSLSRALDILDIHLESGEILSRWSTRWWIRRPAETLDDWEWLLEDMLKLSGKGDSGLRGAFGLLSQDEVLRIFLGGILSTGNFNIAKVLIQSSKNKLSLSSEVIEDICLSCSRELYDNASSGNYTFGDMKLAHECLDVPPPSDRLLREKEFIEATSRLSSFNVMSGPGISISPIEIRLTKDRLSLVSRVLSSNNDAYKHTEVILDLVHKLGLRNNVVAEVKTLAMLADTALQAEDFLRAYETSERMVETVLTLRSSFPDINNPEIQEASEVCWVACFQLGRQPEFEDVEKKLSLLGRALELCPPEKLHDVLVAWRRLENEDIEAREERLSNRRDGKATTRKPVAASSTTASLRSRLQDFHMPSPPLLNTPDAAALASRTFRSVAANFPFSVANRGRSQASHQEQERSRSGSRRRVEGEDVSSQATRVFSKGIDFTKDTDGWLCNVCNSSGDHTAHMNIHAALRHERNSAQHARNVSDSEMWWNPSSQDPAAWDAPLEEDPPLTREELQIREHQYHVGRVADIVPYWIKCVNAAANGEELRLEPFLETLQDAPQSWMNTDNPWAYARCGDWGGSRDAGRWGVHPDAKSLSSARGSRTQTRSRTISTGAPTMGETKDRKGTARNAPASKGDTYAFVEDIARQEAADAERKRKMHMFFDMPTHEKVKKIDEIVRCLRLSASD